MSSVTATLLCESADAVLLGSWVSDNTTDLAVGRSPIEFYKFLRETKWQNPTDAAHTAMHSSYNTDLPNCFEYLRSVGLGPQTNHHSKCYQRAWTERPVGH